MKHVLKTLYTVAIVALIACAPQAKQKSSDTDPLVLNRDTTVSPAVDFFKYANGGWFKRNPVPASETSNGLWLAIRDSIASAVKNICESSADQTNAERGSSVQKIGDFYFTGMDTIAIEKQGMVPIEDEIKAIDAISGNEDMLRQVAHMQAMGAPAMFAFYVRQDDRFPTANAAFLRQGGLGMPNRDYYFRNDDRTKNIRKEYKLHLSKMFELAGEHSSRAEQFAETIVKIETHLAQFSRTLEALRDPYANYNKMSIADLDKRTQTIKWKSVFNDLGISTIDSVVVGQPEFLIALDDGIRKTSLADWKVYLKWHLLNAFAPYLSKKFDDQDFYFYRKILRGQTEQKPRWKRIVDETDGSLGELIGQIYVVQYLPKGTKEKLVEIGNNIAEVFRERLQKVDWMSAATKDKAIKKMNTMVMKVGYPDKWRDYSALQIDRSSYAANVKRANRWAFDYMVKKFGKPVDRTEWNITPQTYNAYYDQSNNEIVVPACNIFVPGYEKELPDDAILYGIIGGSTFGHEITHGFDDEGSQYDETGALNNWWAKEDRDQFMQRSKKLVTQFDNYVVLDSLHLRGQATLGENIADLGGVIMGYEALKKTGQWKSQQKINGLSPDQRYFLAYAYAWMIQERSESIANQVMTDVHSPAQYRVNGPLANIPEFFDAFKVKPGDPMYRPDSLIVRIW